MKWAKWMVGGLIITIISGIGVKEWQRSLVVGQGEYRFNMVMIEEDKGVSFVSFDPTENTILVLPFPSDLAIPSRMSGEYSISSLYKLGAYGGDADAKAKASKGGEFVRRKIQGFMRVPIPGYQVNKRETNLSLFDKVLLRYRKTRYRYREIKEEELVRAGVVENNTYHPGRLQEYVGTRLFDWGIGAGGVAVAIVNASGENGLGSDMADFLSNLGLDVVMVRSGNESEKLEVSEWQVDDQASADKLGYIFQSLFGFNLPTIEKVGEEYRAKVLVRVGKDARELF